MDQSKAQQLRRANAASGGLLANNLKSFRPKPNLNTIRILIHETFPISSLIQVPLSPGWRSPVNPYSHEKGTCPPVIRPCGKPTESSDIFSKRLILVGIMLACTAAVAAAVGWQMLVGLLAGVIVTLMAAAIAGTDFE